MLESNLETKALPKSSKNKTEANILQIKDASMSSQYIPASHDFVVYVLKRKFSKRVKRLYQCLCNTTTNPKSNQSKHYYDDESDTTPNKDMVNINSESQYKTICNLINNGKLGDVPSSLFSSGCSTRTPCFKIFCSISKFYAHLRIHLNDKPFQCPIPGCTMRFTQKGNMFQHLERIHLVF